MSSETSETKKDLILLIEDDPFLRDIFSRKLQGSSFGLLTATEGSQALELAREKQPTVILLDLNLPGVDGFEILKSIRSDQLLKDTLVLVLTNSVLSEDITKSNELRADDFLTKANFNMDEIIERIEQHVAKKAVK